MKIYNLFIVILLIFSCKKQKLSLQPAFAGIVKFTHPNFIRELEIRKLEIDSLFKQNEDRAILLAKINNKIVKITEDYFSEDIEKEYIIFKNENNEIILISEFLTYNTETEESVLLTYYFNETDKLFAFEKEIHFINKKCYANELVSNEIQYFDNKFKMIKEIENLTDKKGSLLSIIDCKSSLEENFKIYPTVKLFLKEHKINTIR